MKTVYFLFCVFLFGCRENSENLNFQKRIPIDNFGNFNLDYLYKKEQTKYAKLDLIENGFDSFCIRVWYQGFLNNDQQLIEFRKGVRSKIWESDYYYLACDSVNVKLQNPNVSSNIISDSGEYYYHLDTSQTMLTIIKREKILEPKSGWENFGQKLLETGILSAPDYTIIKDYQIINSDNIVLVEIATKNYYRMFSYRSLNDNIEIKSTLKVLNFIRFIEDNFNLKIKI
jgi:hypothetical protein